MKSVTGLLQKTQQHQEMAGAAAAEMSELEAQLMGEQSPSMDPAELAAQMEQLQQMQGFMAGWDAHGQAGFESMNPDDYLEHDFEKVFAEQMQQMQLDGKPGAMQGFPAQFPSVTGANADAWLHRYTERLRMEGDEELADVFEDALQKEAPEYSFSESNVHAGTEVGLKEGVDAYQRGELQDAVLHLEVEVMRSPDCGDAWQFLGMAQAELDNDRQAIAALLKCVEVDSGNLDALLELGISCCNELDQAQALCFLQSWLEAHPVHRVAVEPSEIDMHSFGFQEHVTKQFNKAVEGVEDPDLYCALGVLASLRQDFKDASHWFKRGLKLKPQSHSLWNKLGAVEANGKNAAAAVHAYNQALQLKPSYARAWVNSGIAYLNQEDYSTAAQYFIRAIELNPTEHLWNHLQVTLVKLDREDLIEKVREQNVEALREIQACLG